MAYLEGEEGRSRHDLLLRDLDMEGREVVDPQLLQSSPLFPSVHVPVTPSPSFFVAHSPLVLLHTQDEVSTDPVIARLEPLPDAEDKSVEVCVRQDARRPYSVRARLGQLMQHSPRIKLAVESGKTAATYRRSGFGQRQTRPTDGAQPYLYDDEVGVLTIDDEWSEKPGQTQHGHLDEEVRLLFVCMWIWEFIHNWHALCCHHTR